MRLREIPRGMPSEEDQQVAQPLELGSGMKDVHVGHGMSNQEREHFDRADANADPRAAPSNFHDAPQKRPDPGVLIDDMTGPKASQARKIVCRGEIVGCFMHSDGAHVELLDDETGAVHFLFRSGCNHMISGSSFIVYLERSGDGNRLIFREVD